MVNDRFVAVSSQAGVGQERSFRELQPIPLSSHSLRMSKDTTVGSIPITCANSPFESARAWLQSGTGFRAKNAELGAAAGLDLTPPLVGGTMKLIMSPSEAPQRKRRDPVLVAGVPLYP